MRATGPTRLDEGRPLPGSLRKELSMANGMMPRTLRDAATPTWNRRNRREAPLQVTQSAAGQDTGALHGRCIREVRRNDGQR